MKILMINSVCGIRSTGRICTDLAEQLEKEGNEVKIAYGREIVPERFERLAVRIGGDFDAKLSAIHTRLTDRHGFANKRATARFLKWATEYDPELLWLHNIHGYYINVEMLFAWIKSRPQMKVKWTLHDCWAFTGHCSHFTVAKCDKWKLQCEKCAQKERYPKSRVLDNSYGNFQRKKAAFTGVERMQINTPSKWLAGLVKESFLSEYPVEVVYNTIDLNVFKPTEGDFRERYGLEKKKLIIGVASTWDERKGLQDFLKLSGRLGEDCAIVLVGLDNKQMSELPANIIGIKRTNSPRELAALYSAADVFFNPTYEDNYPTVNLEAEACGTPVVTYDAGGSRETVKRADSCVIEVGDLESFVSYVGQMPIRHLE